MDTRPSDSRARLGALTFQAACPFCGHPHLEYQLRCELSYGGCLHVARCPSCRMSYRIDIEACGPPAGRALSCDATRRSCRLVPIRERPDRAG